MAITGVLCDFSGTLMRVEPAERWLRTVLDRHGTRLPDEEVVRLAGALEAAGALPGGGAPREVPAELAGLWWERDRDPSGHRELYLRLARRVPLPSPELYEALYERHMEPDAWQPYPDTRTVLAALRERGVRVAVVSNIGWDLRPVFREHGLDRFVNAYALSFEHHAVKPEPRLFRIACAELGLVPQHTVMVGDDARADGGAAAVGCAVHLVRHLPVDERPDGLLPVLDLVG
ncbi:HAD family hydrolase [Streptomyces sp. XM4011]|uniref:HAD family hydrolase n=1 Tax=Streptomyces sp. XM4011 TaxID=2929780 RepID=UPI001FFBD843|nr:HAD family hydrolase [Streptomyces sp. XM4011]MCK1816266.1 HAD family hydrolase [Streptomyces sp. XM4011]